MISFFLGLPSRWYLEWYLGGQLGDTEIIGLTKGNNRKNTNMREMIAIFL